MRGERAMKFKDKYRFVRKNMKKNRTRVVMTIVASMIGCAFLIMLASIGFAFHKSAVDDVMGRRLMNQIEIQGQNGPLKDNNVKELRRIKGVKAVTKKQFSDSSVFKYNDYSASTSVMAVDMKAEKKAGLELSAGRMPTSKYEILVGYHFAESFVKEFPENAFEGMTEEESAKKVEKNRLKIKTMLGEKVIHEFPVFKGEKASGTEKAEVTIVGVKKKPSKEWMDDSSVFISEDLIEDIIAVGSPDRRQEPFYEVAVYTNSAEDVKAVTEKIEDKGYMTYSVIKDLKELNVIFIIFKAGLIFIGAIAVLIASIGIFNTMTMAVTERSQDIGIMKAIGANPGTIKKIFLLESGYIGFWGAVLGTLLAYAVSYLINFGLPIAIEQFTDEKMPENFIFSYIPWSLTAIAVGICMSVTLISGWRPAAKATQVDVLKALRRDI
jgi:acetoin utilization transport system permease protein